MINYNGTIQESSSVVIEKNRGFLYGDSVFETLRVHKEKILFLEDHYFRLMASMRICRMEIPMNFTLEFFEAQILKLISAKNQATSSRVRFTVYRMGDGFYLPTTNDVAFIITTAPVDTEIYTLSETSYEVELYKDFFISKQLISTLKTNNKMIQITGSVFASENGFDNCLLLNNEKNVIEALQSNIFMKMGNTLITPPIADGCLNGIMRKQVLNLSKKISGIEVVEQSISPFDLQKADELFLTNVTKGIQPITKYRKKEYEIVLAKEIVKRVNAFILLN